jgi:hypothetical protein
LLGALITGALSLFGLVAVFVDALDEPWKLWLLAVALLSIGVGCISIWLWRRGSRRDTAPARRADRRAAAAVACAALTIAVIGAARAPAREPTKDPTARVTPSVANPTGDVRMHELWASSAENLSLTLVRRTPSQTRTGNPPSWAMTDFTVTQPYLRSIEVAAAADRPGRLQLLVYNEHSEEVASGEADIDMTTSRAKVTFEKSRDISPYLGKRLFLMARNIFTQPVRVYFSKSDLDRSVTSYVDCGAHVTSYTACPNPYPRDLSTLVVGRARP